MEGDGRVKRHGGGRCSARGAGPERRLAVALVLGAVLAIAAGVAPSRAEGTIEEPLDYRLEDYRSPTPATLEGARVVDTAAAQALWKEGKAAFVDVLPRAPKPANLPAGTIWRDKPRDDIPGSTWLPNVGYGALSAEMEAYFRRGLEAVSGGDRAKPLVFYCLRDCWMSWNAAKRALDFGYTQVIWYPDGTDGWSEGGLALKPAEPMK